MQTKRPKVWRNLDFRSFLYYTASGNQAYNTLRSAALQTSGNSYKTASGNQAFNLLKDLKTLSRNNSYKTASGNQAFNDVKMVSMGLMIVLQNRKR